MQQHHAPSTAAAAMADPNTVLELLLAALSHNPEMQKRAEHALHELETRPGYVSCLAVGVHTHKATIWEFHICPFCRFQLYLGYLLDVLRTHTWTDDRGQRRGGPQRTLDGFSAAEKRCIQAVAPSI
jgi:hypothetical protein